MNSSKWTVLLDLLFMAVRVGSELTYFSIYTMLNYENRLIIKSCRLWGGLNIRRSLSQRWKSWLRLSALCILMDPHSLSLFLFPSVLLPSSATVSASYPCHDLLLYIASIKQLLWCISCTQVKSSLPKDPDVNHTKKQDDCWLEHGFISFYFFKAIFSFLPFPLEILEAYCFVLFCESIIFHPFPVL